MIVEFRGTQIEKGHKREEWRSEWRVTCAVMKKNGDIRHETKKEREKATKERRKHNIKTFVPLRDVEKTQTKLQKAKSQFFNFLLLLICILCPSPPFFFVRQIIYRSQSINIMWIFFPFLKN